MSSQLITLGHSRTDACSAIGNRSHTPKDSERAALAAGLEASRHAFTKACQMAAGDDRIVQVEAKLQEAQQLYAVVGVVCCATCTSRTKLDGSSILAT